MNPLFLQGMKERSKLKGIPELGLKNGVTHRDNVDVYGHLVHQALLKVCAIKHK